MDKVKEELRFLIGESIILFQRYEYTFKSLLTLSLIHGTTETLRDNLKNRSANISKKSLGQLVRQYLDEVVDPVQLSAVSDEEVQSIHINMSFSIESASLTKSDIEAKFKSFVDDRNFVVHHLISELVPDNQSGYKAMISRLSDINQKFEKDLQDMLQTRQAILDVYTRILGSEELESLM